MLVLREGGLAFSTDVQNYRTVRYSCFGICDVEREAWPTAILAVPYGAYPYRWWVLFLLDDPRGVGRHSINLGTGMTVTFFFQVTDTGQESILYVASNSDHSYSFLVYRVVVGDRTIHHFLLYHFFVARVVCGDLRIGGEFDG